MKLLAILLLLSSCAPSQRYYMHTRQTLLVYHDEQIHASLPTYKNEFDLAGGYHVENGRDPRPLGGVWLHLFWDAKARGYVGHEMIRAT